MTPQDYVEAARVPRSLKPQTFGLWTIERAAAGESGAVALGDGMILLPRDVVGFPDYTLLLRHTLACEMGGPRDVVMEDSRRELRKHLPIWLAASGRVLVTGLGLGCVVRGLLANRDVDEIVVVELDRQIARVVGHEFSGNRRVRLHVGDALRLVPDGLFDFAWHDLWVDSDDLQVIHARLFRRFGRCCGRQGAWAFPRGFARMWERRTGEQLLGAPRFA